MISEANRRRTQAEAPCGRMPRRMRAARGAESVPATPPGTRSRRRRPWRRLNARVRSATKSIASFGKQAQHFRGSLGIDRCQPLVAPGSQRAVARASSSSFLRALPVESTRTRAESLGGTSTTDSPAAANLPARCRPRPPAFSTAQRRLGNRFAQRSRGPSSLL